MGYSLPYLIIESVFLTIAAVEIFIHFDQKSIKILNALVGLIFIVFFGFRGFIGWDWNNYYPFFKSIQPISHLKIDQLSYEIGFGIFSSIVKTISSNYHFFVFINTLIDFILLHLFLKKHLPDYLYAFAFSVFIVMGGLIFEIDLLRNIKGLLLFLISIRYIEERKILPFFALNILGVLFHWSSIVFIPLYFFIHKKLDLRFIIVLIIIGNIIYLFQIQFIKPFVKLISELLGSQAESKSEIYLNSSLFNKNYGITVGYIERIFSTILILIYYNRLIEKSKSMIIFVNSFFVYFILFFYFSELSIMISRVARLFYFSYWIVWPAIIDESKNTTKYLLFLPMAIFMNLKIIKSTNNILYKYDNTLWEKTQDYNVRNKIFKKNADILQKNN